MGKQPTTGQKKSKDQIAKAATQKKGAHKKWTKGKAKEKVDHAVFVDKATHERLITGIPKLGKHISVSQVIEKFKVVGSIARMVLKQLVDSGAIKSVEQHSKQALFTPVAVAVEKTAVTTTGPAEKDAKKAAPKKEKAPAPAKKEQK